MLGKAQLIKKRRKIHSRMIDIVGKETVIWRQYPDYPFVEVNQFGQIKSKMRFHGGVIAINPSSFKIFCFKSQSEASSQLNISIQSICAVVHGRLNTTGGFWFCKYDSDTIEKTRNKFSEEIAHKVEKLMSKNCN